MFELTVVGASPSCPNPGGASAGYLLRGPQGRFLLDCGHGIAGAVQTFIELDQLEAIVISHMHPDHFLDLLPLRYGLQFYGVDQLPLYLPPDGKAFLDRMEPVLGLPHGFFARYYRIDEYAVGKTIPISGLKLAFFPTQHYIPAYALRISNETSTLFYSADTGPNEAVADFAHGADLGLIEATLDRQFESSETPGHMSGTEAGRLAYAAGVKRLLLTHYWRPYADIVLREAQEVFGPNVSLAKQGEVYAV